MARIKGPRKVHRYSVEFKLKAVQLSDLEAFEARKREPNLDFEQFVKALKRRGKL